MRFCGNCGTQLKTNAKFCTHCGQRPEDKLINWSATEIALGVGAGVLGTLFICFVLVVLGNWRKAADDDSPTPASAPTPADSAIPAPPAPLAVASVATADDSATPAPEAAASDAPVSIFGSGEFKVSEVRTILNGSLIKIMLVSGDPPASITRIVINGRDDQPECNLVRADLEKRQAQIEQTILDTCKKQIATCQNDPETHTSAPLPSTPTGFTEANKLYYLGNDSSVLSAPEDGSVSLATVHSGRPIHIIGLGDSYLWIIMHNGITGFISRAASQAQYQGEWQGARDQTNLAATYTETVYGAEDCSKISCDFFQNSDTTLTEEQAALMRQNAADQSVLKDALTNWPKELRIGDSVSTGPLSTCGELVTVDVYTESDHFQYTLAGNY